MSRFWTRKPRPAPETGRILQQHGHSQPHDRQQQQQLLWSPCLLGRLACCLRTLDCRLGLLEPGSLAPPPPPTCSAVSVSVLCSIAGISIGLVSISIAGISIGIVSISIVSISITSSTWRLCLRCARGPPPATSRSLLPSRGAVLSK